MNSFSTRQRKRNQRSSFGRQLVCVEAGFRAERVHDRWLVAHQRRPPDVDDRDAVDAVLRDLAQDREHLAARLGERVRRPRREAPVAVDRAQLGVLLVEPAGVPLVLGRREREPGGAVAGVELEAELVRVVECQRERVEAGVAEPAPVLGVHPPAAVLEVVDAVAGEQATGLAQVVQGVAHAGFPVVAREVRVPERLELPVDVLRASHAPEPHEAVRVAVGIQPLVLRVADIRVVGGDLLLVERLELDVGDPRSSGRPADDARPVILVPDVAQLTEHDVLAGDIGRLPVHVVEDPLGARRHGQDAERLVPRELDLKRLDLVPALLVDADRDSVPALDVEAVPDLGRIRLVRRNQHLAREEVRLVRDQPPRAALGRCRERVRRAACLHVREEQRAGASLDRGDAAAHVTSVAIVRLTHR